MKISKTNWLEPINFAQKIAQNCQGDWVFLYSGLDRKSQEVFSYLALFPEENFSFDKFNQLQKLFKNQDYQLFGYISYEALRDIEDIKTTQKNSINFEAINFIKFGAIVKFCHKTRQISISYSQDHYLSQIDDYLKTSLHPKIPNLHVKNIESNFSDQSYLSAIDSIKQQIASGEFYQINLTRKFFGKLQKTYQNDEIFANFVKLCQISPANYASFLKIGEKSILSSSPELFLKIKDNLVISKPIKGTSPRSDDVTQDQDNKNYLKNSEKERAENLMIVDLVRNDLSQICKSNSVKVDSLFDVDSYATIHHMSSQISGVLPVKASVIEAIKATFPAGSMTGAPKIAAMQQIANYEKLDRGIYSGAIGFISQNEVNLSVVIRTLIIEDNQFEFQVGGAITYDSDPKQELAEIYNKAQAIFKLLKTTNHHSQ